MPWADCGLEVADHPELAVPPLVWEDCVPAASGCSRVSQAFVTPPSSQPGRVGAFSALKVNGGYTTAMVLERTFEPEEGEYAVVYAADNTPMLAWRVVIPSPPSGPVACQVTRPILTASRMWFGGQSEEPPYRSYYADGSVPRMATLTHHINQEQSSQLQAASIGAALALQPLGGLTTLVYDRIDRTTDVLGVDHGVELNIPMVYPVNESAIFLQAKDRSSWQGWIWNHATHTTEPLIVAPAGQVVVSLASDGTTLAWIQSPPQAAPPLPSQPGDLWTAPFATSQAGVVATKIRPSPPGAIDGSVASHGYYAPGTDDLLYHVYRLSDGHHWSFTPSPAASGVYYVDDTYVVYSDGGYGIIRQEIAAALGPGD